MNVFNDILTNLCYQATSYTNDFLFQGVDVVKHETSNSLHCKSVHNMESLVQVMWIFGDQLREIKSCRHHRRFYLKHL